MLRTVQKKSSGSQEKLRIGETLDKKNSRFRKFLRAPKPENNIKLQVQTWKKNTDTELERE